MLPGFSNEKSHNTLLVFGEGAMKHILRAKVWLYGSEIVFWQNLTDFFLLSNCCSFCNHIKIKYRQILFPIFKKNW